MKSIAPAQRLLLLSGVGLVVLSEMALWIYVPTPRSFVVALTITQLGRIGAYLLLLYVCISHTLQHRIPLNRSASSATRPGGGNDLAGEAPATEVDVTLGDSDALLRTVIASAPIFFFALDRNGAFVLLEGKGLDALQLTPGDSIGRSVFDVYRETPRVIENNRRALAGEAFTAIVAVAGLVFETRYSPLRDHHGQVVSVIGVATDITEREHAKEALQEQRDFAMQVMNTMGQGLGVTNAERRFEFVNPALARILGYPASELIGMSLFEIVHPADYAIQEEALQQRFAGKSTTYEIRLRRADDRIVYGLVSGVPRWRDDTVIGSIAVLSDLTERRQMEQALKLARNQALEASRLKSEFLATMSHEIRTPMNAIIGMTELLLASALTSDQHDLATTVHESGQALLTIIDDILDFSKIEADKLILEHTPFNLIAVVEGAAELLASRAHAKHLALMTCIAADVPSSVCGDPVRLRQILLNLISNAVKFTDQGEVSVHVTLASATPTHVVVHFAVRDTGIGLSSETQAHLFQPFTQEDGSTTRKYGGTGLGLAISKRLSELMDGSIGVESVRHQGATFWFTARFERVDALLNQPDLRSLRALIVSASQTGREVLQSYAAAWQIRYTGALSASMALSILHQAAQSDPYRMVIVDRDLPDMDGVSLARTIHADPHTLNVRLLLLTTSPIKLAGGFTCLTWPVKQAHLLHVCIGQTSGSASVTPASPRPPHSPAAPIRAGRVEKLILLVEDNPANQQLTLRQLQQLGYTAHAVSNGREAVEAIECAAAAYWLVLMDCRTPEMDGFTATQHIRKLEQPYQRHVPIIAITANAMRGDRDACLAAGMDDYISKPVSLECLRTTLEKWLPQTRASVSLMPDAALTDTDDQTLDPAVIASLLLLQQSGSTAFLSELISLYVHDVPLYLDTIYTAMAQGNMSLIHESAHSLKGSSASIGARTMTAFCQELETLSRSGISDGVAELVQRIEAEFVRVKAALEAECARSHGKVESRK